MTASTSDTMEQLNAANIHDDDDFLQYVKEVEDKLQSEYHYDNDDAETNITVPSSDIDLMPDEEKKNIQSNDQLIDFSELSSTENEDPSETQVVKKRSRKKRRHVSKEEWEVHQNKRKRCLGLEYAGLAKNDGKWKFSKLRQAKKLKPPCACAHSNKKSMLQCNILSEKHREDIFKSFWKKSWPEKKQCVINLVDVKPVKQIKTTAQKSRRHHSLYFHLKMEGTRIRVCKKQFLNTLAIGEWSVLNWVKAIEAAKKSEDKEENESRKCAGERKKSPRATNRKKEAEEIFLINFLSALPNVESHYCRASSTKKYLEPIWKSKQELYRLYKTECEQKKIMPLSIATFGNKFDDMNYSLFKTKKDQCDTCLGFKIGNVDELVFNEHIKKKDAARVEKAKDKENEKWVFTMDLQSVLMAPLNKASAMYYRSKLVVHNFTIFNLKNKDGYCYLWHEGQGGLTANEFASILFSFVESLETEKGDQVVIYSDGCTYQNRNSTISNMFLLCSMKNGITIIQKYLEKGHTQMECDSMHSVIERKLRNTEISTPAGYVSVCKSARLQPKPYHTTYLSFDFFKNFSGLSYYRSIRPGFKKGDPQVTHIRCIKYSPNGILEYKINYEDEWQILPKRRLQQEEKITVDTPKLPQLYNKPLEIDKQKFDNLQLLKTVIEKDFHSFYDNLPHKV